MSPSPVGNATSFTVIPPWARGSTSPARKSGGMVATISPSTDPATVSREVPSRTAAAIRRPINAMAPRPAGCVPSSRLRHPQIGYSRSIMSPCRLQRACPRTSSGSCGHSQLESHPKSEVINGQGHKGQSSYRESFLSIPTFFLSEGRSAPRTQYASIHRRNRYPA